VNPAPKRDGEYLEGPLIPLPNLDLNTLALKDEVFFFLIKLILAKQFF